MQRTSSFTLPRVLTILAALLVWKVTLSVVFEYRNYFPPNFESDFLRGREPYFWGAYRWAFYTHLVSGPASLMLGTILVSDRFRRFVPTWHRRLGRMQAAACCCSLAPSGLWMAYYAATGAIAAAGTWLAGDSHRGVRGPRVEIRGHAEICQPPTLDVAHVHPLVLGSRDPDDRWIGDGRSFRSPMALPAFDLGELARAAAGVRVRPVTQAARSNVSRHPI